MGFGDFRYGDEFLAGAYRPGARDQRLESFAQGGWGDRGCWGDGGRAAGWLAMQAGDVSQPEVLHQATSDEVLGVGRAWKSLETWCFAGKLAVVRELIRRYPLHEDDEPGSAAGGLPHEWDPRLHHEVAAALGISLVAAGKLVNLAWTLDSRLRGIGKALDELRLDPPRVRLIVDETSVLDREDLFARAEAIILAGLSACKTWSDLQRLVQRAVITVDPDGARKRREQAEREHARIQFWREAAGTCALRGTGLPTDQALAATANIEARAREYKAVPVKRPMDILRVMAYLDLINGVPVAQRALRAQAEDEARQAQEAARQAGKAGQSGPDADAEQAARDARLREAARQARQRAREKARDKARRTGDPDDRASQADPDGLARRTDSGDRARQADSDDDPARRARSDNPASHADSADLARLADLGRDAGPGDDLDDGDGWGPGGNGPGTGGPGGPVPAGDGHVTGPGTPGPITPSSSNPGPSPGNLSSGTPCPATPSQASPGRGGNGCTGLPVRANLTIPAGALEWLAERSRHQADGTGGGGGPGGPGDSGLRDAGAPSPAGQVPLLTDLALPLLTLLGLARRPGEADGLGALDPSLARALASAGARYPRSEFCLTVVDEDGYAIGHGCCRPLRGMAGSSIPVARERATFTRRERAGPQGGFGAWLLTLPGAPLPFTVDIDVVPTHECDHRHASAGYVPSGRLRHLVQVRDGTCSFPACSRHARESDWEHARPFAQGGATCACNAHACSRACHRVKQSAGWQVTKPRPGWTRWTTMAGRTYVQEPWRYEA